MTTKLLYRLVAALFSQFSRQNAPVLLRFMIVNKKDGMLQLQARPILQHLQMCFEMAREL